MADTGSETAWPTIERMNELEVMEANHAELWAAYESASSPQAQEDLTVELKRSQAAIAECRDQLGLAGPQASVPRTSRSSVINRKIDDSDSTMRLKSHPVPVSGPSPGGTRPPRSQIPASSRPNPGAHRHQPSGGVAPGPRPQPAPSRWNVSPWLPFLVGGLVVGLGFAWLALAGPLAGVFNPDADSDPEVAGPVASNPDTPATDTGTGTGTGDALVGEISAVLSEMGVSGAVVERRDDVIHISGVVPTERELQTATGAATALANGEQVNASGLIVLPADGQPAETETTPATGLDPRQTMLAGELDRLLAATPLVFEPGQSALGPLHLRILNNVALILNAYPDLTVQVVGFSDTAGATDGLGLTRADEVSAYLVSQGVDEANLVSVEGDATVVAGDGATLGTAMIQVGG